MGGRSYTSPRWRQAFLPSPGSRPPHAVCGPASLPRGSEKRRTLGRPQRRRVPTPATEEASIRSRAAQQTNARKRLGADPSSPPPLPTCVPSGITGPRPHVRRAPKPISPLLDFGAQADITVGRAQKQVSAHTVLADLARLG